MYIYALLGCRPSGGSRGFAAPSRGGVREIITNVYIYMYR